MEIERELKRLTADGNLPHAILLSGSKQAELLVLAENLAAAILNVENIVSHPDFIRIDSNKVEDVRRLLGLLNLRSFGSRAVLLESAEDLTAQAVNSLLKRVEEPSDRTYFIVLTVHEEKLLPTLLSRLTVFREKRRVDPESDSADKFFGLKGLGAKLSFVKTLDPHQEDINAFLKRLYSLERKNPSSFFAVRLESILKVFEMLSVNVQASRALSWLVVKWEK